jgi:large subunit ribosomal protein L24
MAKPTPYRHANKPKERVEIKIRKDDTVRVIAGKDKGKTGRVLEVLRNRGRVLVEGVSMSKKHTRPNPAKQIKGGIAERESSIHISNVMILTPGGVPTRIGYKTEGNRRVRVAKKGGDVLDKK